MDPDEILNDDTGAQPEEQGREPVDVPAGDEGAPEQEAPRQSAAEAFLDTLTEGGEPDAGRPRDEHGRFVSRGDAPAGEPGEGQPEPAAAGADPGQAAAQGQGQPQPRPPQQRTPEQEDAELLAGIKSERGKARVQEMITARREAEGNVAAVREMISSAGLTAETFGQHLEFARLASSTDPRDLQQAAQILEATRGELYRRLGQDAPGFDALADHPDLAQRVQNLEMPREAALELVRARRMQQEVEQQRQAEQAQVMQRQQFDHAVVAAQRSLEQYVASRQHEVDHPARMRAVEAYFADPAKMREFTSTYRPDQWPAAIRMLYDHVQVAPQRRAGPAPLTSRPAPMGTRTPAADASPGDRIMGRLDEMGI
ncbi:hypothetical protein CUR95_24035 [Bordetella bronchiseptica]|nr:hypothetical protein [Bordetella bronchiseptica]